ncbi:3-hydroxyacyl-CoA dehydrogenase family protein [Aeromicrobium sp. Marseille-Q0843]|uniref:3-hydroxyacyl-CoA dehydrogenase family protein n=1 Tax=Aeromicrobium phoceense TaxID=2754045 RepID=A0A838XH03_9ACTN|nr:3-hydroxyacyl-CoA dehydrogenase family protein [Aeromicrobium phoceense]MBA4609127.1 3-hydroxyacyl-CoA dehydrogenase family protein [Aeromicrobium phoceense]
MSVPTTVGVYGGGRMGAGIAHAFLLAGARVIVVEANSGAADAAKERVAASLEKAQERGVLSAPAADVRARLSTTVDASDLEAAELVVEAVPEDVALKQRVLRSVAEVAPAAWLATNTSSLSVDAIGAALGAPNRLIGLHFFNPVPASDLVEIVVGAKTDCNLVAAAETWVSALGKTAITVSDTPGFASSRLGVAIALEAIRMLEEGVASAGDIDTAMTLGYRHPVGPLRTTDIVGLDVRLAIAEHLAAEVGERFTPPQILRDKVAAGELGRKSGRGFFSW